MGFQVHRYHDISCGHRVVGHEGKCKNLHGHGYRITFTCESDGLDSVGRVIDFGVIKTKLCMWLEDNWDHKTILWEKDPGITLLKSIEPDSIVPVPFNPTAENIAEYLVRDVGPYQLYGTGVKLVSVLVEETRKCSASFTCEKV